MVTGGCREPNVREVRSMRYGSVFARWSLCAAVLLVFGLLGFGVAFEQTIVLPTGQEATINWDDGELHSTGQAVPPGTAEHDGQKRLMARRGAILDAQRNLLETLSQVHVTSDATMINLMAQDVVRTQVEGVVQGAIIVGEEWDEDLEIYSVRMAIPLSAAQRIVLPAIVIDPPDAGDAPTGLVLDVRDLNAVPSLSFRIHTRSGVEVAASARGFYVTALPGGLGSPVDEVSLDPRVADDPMVIRVVDLAENRIDLVISDADGERLARYLRIQNYFQDGRALLIMN